MGQSGGVTCVDTVAQETRQSNRPLTHTEFIGYTSLYSIDYAGKPAMRELASDFGVTRTLHPEDTHQVIYKLDLTEKGQLRDISGLISI